MCPEEVLEAADSFGASTWQRLIKVQIPLALPNIFAGVNQTIMMSLAMVVIAAQVLSALWVGAIAYCNVELAVAAEDHRPTIVYGAIQGCKFHEDDFAIGQGVIAICGKTADAVKVTAGYGIKDVIVVVDLKAGVKDEPAQTTLVVIVYFNTQEWVRQ